MNSLFDAPEAVAAPSTAIGVYNPELSKKRRDEAMDAAELGAVAHIGDDWIERALDAVKRTAEVLPHFSVDDVTPALDQMPAEGRAMGPVMRRAVKAGYMEPTNIVHRSSRVTSHAGPRTYYKSLIYKGGAE